LKKPQIDEGENGYDCCPELGATGEEGRPELGCINAALLLSIFAEYKSIQINPPGGLI